MGALADTSRVSFSSLIIANPSSTSASQGVPGALGDADSFVTPSNVDVPRASATLSLNGDLPSLSLAPSQLGASETGSGVRVVGQTQEEAQGQSSVESGSVTGGESDAASESGGDESNSAGPVAGSIGMAGMAVAATLSIVAGLA